MTKPEEAMDLSSESFMYKIREYLRQNSQPVRKEDEGLPPMYNRKMILVSVDDDLQQEINAM